MKFDIKDQDTQSAAVSMYLSNYKVTSGKTKRQTKGPSPENKTPVEQNLIVGPQNDTAFDVNSSKGKLPSQQGQIKEKRQKTSGDKILYTAAVLAILAAIGSVLYLFKPWEKLNQVQKDPSGTLAAYRAYAEAAIEESPSFNEFRWSSPSEALRSFAELVNPGIPKGWEIIPLDGKPFAYAGIDPWGNNYFVTAKQVHTTSSEYAYDFYITCAGQNGKFDTSNFVLDQDDQTSVFLAMSPHIDDITLPGASPSAKEENTNIFEKYESVPISFDKAGGEGGTDFIEVFKNKELPDISIPERIGYVFLGYFDKESGSGTMYFDEEGRGVGDSPFDKGTILYAAWTVGETAKPDSPGPGVIPGKIEGTAPESPPVPESTPELSQNIDGEAEETKAEDSPES